MLPLDDVVVLPHMTVTLGVEGEEQRAALEAARKGNHLVLLVPRLEGRFATVGTVASLGESGSLPDGSDVQIVKGEHRGRLGVGQADVGGALFVQAQPVRDPDPASEEAQRLGREYRALLENLLEARDARQVVQFLRTARTPGHLADLAGYSPDLSLAQKLQVLETIDLEERLRLLIGWTREILAEASLKATIRREVNEGMEKAQREFLLRQQLETIKKQLGEGGGDAVSTYRERVLGADMP